MREKSEYEDMSTEEEEHKEHEENKELEEWDEADSDEELESFIKDTTSDDDYQKNKTKHKNSSMKKRSISIVTSMNHCTPNLRRFLSYEKSILAATCCLYVAIVVLNKSHSNIGKKNPSLRATLTNGPQMQWESLSDIKPTGLDTHESMDNEGSKMHWESLSDIKKPAEELQKENEPWGGDDSINSDNKDFGMGNEGSKIHWESLNDIKKPAEELQKENEPWGGDDSVNSDNEDFDRVDEELENEVGEELKNEEVDYDVAKVEGEALYDANKKIATMEEDINTAETNLEDKIKQVLNEYLIEKTNLSPSKAKEIEEKIHKGVNDKVMSLLSKKEEELSALANEKLDELDEEALESKSSATNAEHQALLDNLKKNLETDLKNDIDNSEKSIIQSLPDFTKAVEMKVFKDEGIELSGKNLDELVQEEFSNIENFLNDGSGFEKTNEELKTINANLDIQRAENEVLDAANDNIAGMEEDIDTAEDTLQDNIKKTLDDFLLKNKKLPFTKAMAVEDKVLSAVDNKVTSLIENEEAEIEDIANDNLDKLDEEVVEDKTTNMDGTDSVTVNQPRLDNMKGSLEEYLKKEIAESENRVIKSLGKVTEDAEKKVFDEEGIDVSAAELASLVEKETKNIKRSGPAASSTDDLVMQHIKEAEDEVLENANDELTVLEEDVDAAEGNLQYNIKKLLREFLINRKDLSVSKAEEIEKKVLERVDDKVTSLIDNKEDELGVVANKNLDKLDEEALKSKSKGIDGIDTVDESRLDNLKEGLETYLRKEIDESEKNLIQSLAKVTEDAEKEVFKEEDIDISGNELADLVEKETKNIENTESAVFGSLKSDGKENISVITDAEDEVLRSANDELSVMEDFVDNAEENLQEGIKKTLDDFLLNDKKLSLLKAMEVEQKIQDKLDDRVESLIGKKEEELEVVANENLDKLDEEALKSKSSNIDGTDTVDQSRLNNLKEGLEKFLKNEIDESEKKLIHSLDQVTKDVETEVFQEEGIDVSDQELKTLVEKEIKSTKKSEFSE